MFDTIVEVYRSANCCVWNVCCHINITKHRRHSLRECIVANHTHIFYRTLTQNNTPQIICLCTQMVCVCVWFRFCFSSRCSVVKQKVCHLFNRLSMKVSGSYRNKKCVRVFVSLTLCMCSISNPIQTVVLSITGPAMNMISVFQFSVSFLWTHTFVRKEKNQPARRWFISQLHLCMHGFEFLLTGQLKLATNIDFLSVRLLSSELFSLHFFSLTLSLSAALALFHRFVAVYYRNSYKCLHCKSKETKRKEWKYKNVRATNLSRSIQILTPFIVFMYAGVCSVLTKYAHTKVRRS